MHAYWREGAERVSLNEVCRRAGVSKAGVYREFGNEDGLKKAALHLYFDEVFSPMIAMLVGDLTFKGKLDALTEGMLAPRRRKEFPTRCLICDMRDCGDTLGEGTRVQLATFRQQTLSAFERMVVMAKAKHEIGDQIPTRSAARYIDSQLTNAVSQQARGESAKVIREVLRLAFSVFD